MTNTMLVEHFLQITSSWILLLCESAMLRAGTGLFRGDQDGRELFRVVELYSGIATVLEVSRNSRSLVARQGPSRGGGSPGGRLQLVLM